MAGFKDPCGLSSVDCTIDVTQIHLQEVKGENLLQLISIHSNLKIIIYIYIYIYMQIIIDHKWIQDVFVGVLVSMNDV
jgi:hypothetical protein